MEQFDFKPKSRRPLVFTFFHFGNDFEVELVGSPGTDHFNFQKFEPGATNFGEYYRVSDKLFHLIWQIENLVHHNVIKQFRLLSFSSLFWFQF